MQHKDLIVELSKIGSIKFGEFTFKNGMVSPQYFDLRILVSYPKTMKKVAEAYSWLLNTLNYDRMAAVPYAALPIVASISLTNQKPWIYTRKEVKDYGTKKLIEGEYKSGDTILVVDDVATDGTSKFEVIDSFQKEKLKINDIAVLIDREQGASKNLSAKGYELHSVLNMGEILNVLAAEKIIDKAMLEKVKSFLAANSK